MSRIENLVYHVKDYVHLRLRLTELKLSYKSSQLVSSLITAMVLLSFAFFFVLVITIGLSLLLSKFLGEWYLGFLIMGGIYVIIGFIFYFYRKQWIKDPVNDLMVKELFDED